MESRLLDRRPVFRILGWTGLLAGLFGFLLMGALVPASRNVPLAGVELAHVHHPTRITTTQGASMTTTRPSNRSKKTTASPPRTTTFARIIAAVLVATS